MKKRDLFALALVILVVLMGVGALAVAAGGAYPSPERSGSPTHWNKNANGVTYGSSLFAVSPEDEPELVLVTATNGKNGYCYRTDLEGPDPSSPAAAVAQQKARGGKPDIVPVYDVNGVKQIGVFMVEHPTGVEFTE